MINTIDNNNTYRQRRDTVQFTQNNKQKTRNWQVFFSEWKAGKYSWDNLTEEEKNYIKQHDACYAQLFI